MATVSIPANVTSCQDAWTRSATEALGDLGADAATGLDSRDAQQRQLQFGRNQLHAARRRSIISIAVDQFRSMVILLLTVAGALAFVFSDPAEGLAIFVVIAINGAIGFFTEWRAIRSMEALSNLDRVDSTVLRDGVAQRIAAFDLVPGDIVLFDGGDIVTADIRLVEAAKLQADESTLTGESLPVGKQTEALPLETPLMDRSNMVFKGTAITRGSGKGAVVSIGLDTDLGRISELVIEAESQQTPLEIRLNALGGRLAIAVLVIAVLIAIAGILAGRGAFLSVQVAVALAVAAIPEGLPIVTTIALARGMWRMARRNALISRLSAVETLGAINVIITDKTGTLTENRMTVTAIQLAGTDITIEGNARTRPVRIHENQHQLSSATSSLLDGLLVNAALCNNASLHESSDGDTCSVGDPTESALLVAALHRGIQRDDLLEHMPELSEVSFDPITKLMATVHKKDHHLVVAVKGAPESVIPLCNTVQTIDGEVPLTDQDREVWLHRASELGSRGLRTLAIAGKTSAEPDGEPFGNLILHGITGLDDPPRAGVKNAISRCRSAGITVVMVTGDHIATARNIAGEVGIVKAAADQTEFLNGPDIDRLLQLAESDELLDARVYSRATPEQKLNLIDFYQRQGHVVAMTGDGVNDAPALKKADIGIAMGIRGTAVAKEAAHMVLQDDELGTIVEAVAQGRAIYENIRKFVVYLLSCNISEMMIVGIATIVGAPLPLLPLQILFLNLVTDVFPALALGVGEGSPSLMRRKPRPSDEPVLTASHWLRIGLHGAVISFAVLGAMSIAVFYLQFDTTRAVTVSFCTLALAQLWHVFNMRDNVRDVFNNEITRNVWIWVSIALCLTLIFTAIYTPLLSDVLGLIDPGTEGWIVISLMSLVPLLLAPLVGITAHRLLPK